MAQPQNFVLVNSTQEPSIFQDLEPQGKMLTPGNLVLKYNCIRLEIKAATNNVDRSPHSTGQITCWL